MFIPIGDDNRDRHLTPFVNYTFLIVNILVFIFLQDMGQNIPFTYAYSTVPGEILTGSDVITSPTFAEDPITGQRVRIPGLQPTPVPVYLTLITSMFMHGDFMHLIGNMVYLWVFGDNLENIMGHKRYFIFYILCGILAGLSHVFSSAYFGENLIIPSLGASGAISGVLGGYILLFPGRSVHVWVLLGVISVPALIAVGLWFVLQIVNGVSGSEASGIAYAAHIGGFIAGLLLVKMFARPVLTQKRGIF